ncbi:MAG: NUDIX hydrolase [Candidatus Competibacteraceae bacterium]|nr:NUDIX hydrolase [Candidatus Competibacteraceae bacterium]
MHAAAARELLEETGLVWQSGYFLQYQDSLPLDAGDFHGINFYFVVQFDGTLSRNLESEDAQWFAPSLLPTLDIAFRNGEALAHFLHGGHQGPQSMKPGN